MIRDFDWIRATMALICLVVADGPRRSAAQDEIAAATAQDETPLQISQQVFQDIRNRDLDAALTRLGAATDRVESIGDLLYSSLPAAAAGVHRMLAQQSSDEQYEWLQGWTLPDDKRQSIRLLTVPVPTEAPPKVFARSLRERPRDTTFAVASVGPVKGLFCSGWVLVQVADDLGRLARLRTTLEGLAEKGVRGAEELLMLAHLAGSRGDLDRVDRYLRSRVESGEAGQAELALAEVVDLAIASAGTLHEQTQPASESLLASMVERSGNDNAIDLRPMLRIAHAAAVQKYRGESSPEEMFRNRLEDWVPATVRSATDIVRGRRDGIWLTHEQHLLHLAGGAADVLFFRYPLQGDFDFICETQEGGSIGTDGGLVYGGLHFQTVGRKDQLLVWDADVKHLVTRVSPFARSDSDPVFNRVSIRSRGDICQFESNFHPVWFDDQAATSSPWLGLRSSGTKRPVFRNLQLTGDPVIPREVALISGDQLRGWQANFFGESLPPFRDARTDPAADDVAEDADWSIQSGELVGRKQATDEAAESPGLLRYQRPLLDGESFRYEFLAEGDASLVHPAVGRLAFLLEPTGIRVRWITTGDTEWTGLEPENAALEPLNRRGPRPLPLQDGQWNTVDVQRGDGKVRILLNDELVYERPLDTEVPTQAGLYRPARNGTTRVRNATLSGDWPETVPTELLRPLTR
ncbi:DUF1583 domain-containing protein [Roseiconus nitratireducens]|nr:DUF1583 domain-containing protein [Roseiconus nitratireducens]